MTKDLLPIFNYLDENFPNARCALIYSKDYELLIAIMLSAQTSDKQVNKATKILFEKYPTLFDLSNANISDVQSIISFLGMSKQKAKNVIDIANILVNDQDGKVPNDPNYLLTLPGVGNKTKNCVLAELFNEPLLAVDTHVQRISKRLGLVKENDSVIVIENKLVKLIPSNRLIKTNHQLIEFGRNICKASHPLCEICKLKQYCKKYKI